MTILSRRVSCFCLVLTLQSKQLVEISSEVEVARFQNQLPVYLPITEAFWNALSSLPIEYEYSAYRHLLDRFGTHYVSEGTLGGRFRALLYFSLDFIESKSENFKLNTDLTQTAYCCLIIANTGRLTAVP